MLADDGLGIACLQGGGSDALELGAVVGDEGVAEDIVAEVELLPECLVALLEVGAVDGGLFPCVGLEPALEVGLDVDGDIVISLSLEITIFLGSSEF